MYFYLIISKNICNYYYLIIRNSSSLKSCLYTFHRVVQATLELYGSNIIYHIYTVYDCWLLSFSGDLKALSALQSIHKPFEAKPLVLSLNVSDCDNINL